MRSVWLRPQGFNKSLRRTDPKLLCRLLLVCALAVMGCSDKNAKQVAVAIEAATRDLRIAQLDLQPYVDRKIAKICIQYPYGIKEDFEERVKQKVVGFSPIGNDGQSVFWFFLSDGTSFQIEMSYWDLRKPSAGCSASSKLLFERPASGGYLYYLEE